MSSDLIMQARRVRTEHHGRQLHLHSVIYPIDYCTSGCTYCGLSTLLASAGAHGVRGAMPPATFAWLVNSLVERGYRTHELVFGTVAIDQDRLTSRVARWVERARRLDPDGYLIVNCDTLQERNYRTLRDAGADAVWTFMEVMTPELYARKHRSGLKADQLQRLEGPARIRSAGLAVGNALLWGLVPDWRAEFDQFVAWAEEVGGFDFVATPVQQSLTLTDSPSVPAGFDVDPPLRVTEQLYQEIVANLRLAFPHARLVANTRLDPAFVYGEISQIADMCNGYVWTSARTHPSADMATQGLIESPHSQMNFYNPGESVQDIQAYCPADIEVVTSRVDSALAGTTSQV
jgi:biotin synthase-like enzyme